MSTTVSAKVIATVCALLVSLGACSTTNSAPERAASGSDGAFPVTIKHAFGETTIEERPQRVVALGWNDLAVATALDAPVVGAVRYLEGSDPNLPYLSKKYGQDVLGMDSITTNLEKIASYEPDLILTTAGNPLEQSVYDKLSALAPTVAYTKSLYGSTMEEDAELIGKALGRSAEARRLIDDAHAKIAALKKELPGLAGKSYLYGQARGTVLPLVVGKDNLSTKFMNSLGLEVPDEFAGAAATDELAPGTIGLSYEQAKRIDSADVLFMTFATPADQDTFKNNAITRDLRVIKEGRYQATHMDTAVALQAPNVAAVGWLLEQLKPTLRTIGA